MSGPLAVALTADITAFEKAMTRAGDLAAKHAQSIATNFVGAATKINAAFATIEGLSKLPGMLNTAATAAVGLAAVAGGVVAGMATISAAVTQANQQLDAFIKLGQNAEKSGVGVEFFQRFSEAATAAKLDVQEIEAALKHAGQAVTPAFEKEDAIKKQLGNLFESGYLGSYQSKGLSDYLGAKDAEDRIRAVVTAMGELRDLGEQLAAIDLAEKLFGPEVAERIRSGRLEIEAIADALNRQRDDLVKQEEVDRAEEFRDRLNEAYQAIDDALHVSVSLAAAGQDVLNVWLKIVEATAEASKVAGSFLDKMVAAARLGNQQSALYPRATQPGEGSLGADLGFDAGASSRGRTLYPQPIGPEKPAGMIDDPPMPPRRPLSMVLEEGKVRPEGAGRTKSAGATPTDPVQTFIDSLSKSAAAAKAEMEAFGKSNVEKAKAIDLAKAQAIAEANGTTLTQAQIDAITKAATATATYKDKLADLQQQQRQAAEASKFFADQLTSGLSDAIVEGKSLGTVLQDLEKSIAKSALQAIFSGSGPLAGLFGTAPAASAGSNAQGGIFGSLFGKLLGGGGTAAAVDSGLPNLAFFADGGHVSGPGTSRSDSIPALLSNGEFVVNAASAAKHRAILEAINTGRVSRFADGGSVGGAPAAGSAGQGSSAAHVISIAPTINLNTMGGGTPAQNADLAKQFSRQVHDAMRQVATNEIRQALRPGGLMNR